MPSKEPQAKASSMDTAKPMEEPRPEAEAEAEAEAKPRELPRPEYPHAESDDRAKFFLIWSPYNRYLSPQTYEAELDAVKAARQAAEDNPGTDWYVLSAVKFAYKARGNAVQKDTK